MHRMFYWFFAIVMVLAVQEKSPSPSKYMYENLRKGYLNVKSERFCGENLAFVLCVICMGSYLPVQYPVTTTIKPRRSRRGIVDECCTRPCSGRTLRQYCGPPPDNNSLAFVCNQK